MTTDTESLDDVMRGLGLRARAAADVLAQAGAEAKNRALREGARAIRAQADAIAAANAKDVADAEAKGLSGALLDRLILNPARITSYNVCYTKLLRRAPPPSRRSAPG